MAFVLLLLLVGAAIAYGAWKSHQRTVAAWRRVAVELGLDFIVGNRMSRPILTGTMAGFPVKVDTYVQRSGNSSTTYTRYRVTYPSLGMNLRLSRHGMLSAITKLFGKQDVEVGDDSFDDAFMVKTDDPSRLRSLLTPSVRSGLLRLLASHSTAKVNDSFVQITRTGFQKKPEVLQSTVHRMLATARLLSSPTAGVSDSMVIDREHGMLAEVATRARDLVEANPDDVEPRIFEIETLAAAGDDTTATTRIADLEKLAPADPDVAGWREALAARPAQPAATPAESTDTDAAATAQELFGGNELSFETRKKFNAAYLGRRVSWEGTVKRHGQSRTVISVATVKHDLYGNTEIDVVAEDTTGISPTEGQTVTVTGTLATIDPLMRNMFVREASLS